MKSTNKIELEHYQEKGMNLGEIINDIRQNFTQTIPMYCYDFKIGETTFQVGPIKYTYKINIESDSIEVSDDFELNFFIDIEGVETESIHFIEELEITHLNVSIFMYDNDDIPDFKAEIEAHFKNHIKQLDLNKKDNLYDYLFGFYQSK